MSDSDLNISVKVKGQDILESLFEKIEGGTSTIAEQKQFVKLATQAWQGMEQSVRDANVTFGNSIVATKDLISNGMNPLLSANGKMKESYFEIGEQLRQFQKTMQDGGVAATESASQSTNRLIDVMKSSRQEHRLGMFAVMEGMHAIEGFTGQENEMAKAVTGGAQAYFGMKFALDAMGGTMASLSTPIAVMMAALSVLSMLGNELAKVYERLNAALIKMGELGISTGATSKEQQVDMLNKQIDALTKQNSSPSIWAALGGAKTLSAEQLAQNIEKQNAITELVVKRDKLENDIAKERIDKDRERYDKLEELQKENFDAEYAGLNLEQQQADAIRQHYIDSINTPELQAFAKGMTGGVREDQPSSLFQNIGGVNTGSNPNGGFSTTQIDLVDQKKLDGFKDESNKMQLKFDKDHDKNVKETEKIQQQAFQDIQGGVSALQGMMEMLHMNTNTFLGSVLEGLNKILMIVETIKSVSNAVSAVSTLVGLIALEKGGDVVPGGGSLQFAADGGTYGFGGLQNVIVGERGAELMQVGRNGVRVISNNNLQQMNQASQASRGGNTQFEIIPGTMTLKANGDLAVAVSLAQRKLNGRTT